MSLFRRTTEIDRLVEADDTTRGVLNLFETAVEDLEYAQSIAADEAAAAQQAIEALRDRQKLANEQADKAARVARKIAALVA